MANHIISLNIPDVMNNCILRIEDTSVYTSTIPVSCPTLQVLVPGFIVATTFNLTSIPVVNRDFIVNLTACNLNLQTTNCGTNPSPLPDGIYVIKYSVSPNDYVYAEYNHLRMTLALEKFKKLLCDLNLRGCEPTVIQSQRLNKLLQIKMYLEAAKAKVEICHEADEGIELYNFAVKQMDKMKCLTC